MIHLVLVIFSFLRVCECVFCVFDFYSFRMPCIWCSFPVPPFDLRRSSLAYACAWTIEVRPIERHKKILTNAFMFTMSRERRKMYGAPHNLYPHTHTRAREQQATNWCHWYGFTDILEDYVCYVWCSLIIKGSLFIKTALPLETCGCCWMLFSVPLPLATYRSTEIECRPPGMRVAFEALRFDKNLGNCGKIAADLFKECGRRGRRICQQRGKNAHDGRKVDALPCHSHFRYKVLFVCLCALWKMPWSMCGYGQNVWIFPRAHVLISLNHGTIEIFSTN